ncbi:unnamed protein product [Hydatigera taeniaeformis]|uniref:Uncharacterized protein n=1 Tax=Hydatigena taeniaeformis TaxID=6205 RepID=A0A0R3WTQ0_HYDTA|nr:unnamed protein product [Hydatigera taeniaeformis]
MDARGTYGEDMVAATRHTSVPEGDEEEQPASHISVTPSLLLVREQSAIDDADNAQAQAEDDENDIISQALRYAGVEPQAQPTATPSDTNEEYDAYSQFHMCPSINNAMASIIAPTLANQSIRIVVLPSYTSVASAAPPPVTPPPPPSTHPVLPFPPRSDGSLAMVHPRAIGGRKRAHLEQIHPQIVKYMRFPNVNHDTAVSVAVATACAAADANTHPHLPLETRGRSSRQRRRLNRLSH